MYSFLPAKIEEVGLVEAEIFRPVRDLVPPAGQEIMPSRIAGKI
jgi:hypothetical protein